jgi:hypothetical protein
MPSVPILRTTEPSLRFRTALLIVVDAALQKPFDVEELLDLLRRMAR